MKKQRRAGFFAKPISSPLRPYVCIKDPSHGKFTSNRDTPRCPVCKTTRVESHRIQIDTTPATAATSPPTGETTDE